MQHQRKHHYPSKNSTWWFLFPTKIQLHIKIKHKWNIPIWTKPNLNVCPFSTFHISNLDRTSYRSKFTTLSSDLISKTTLSISFWISSRLFDGKRPFVRSDGIINNVRRVISVPNAAFQHQNFQVVHMTEIFNESIFMCL